MELEGRMAPPMANGEVVFEAPWQGRVFGMARALCDNGLYEWDEFREYLIAAIDAWEQEHDPSQPYAYYDLFLAAFTRLLAVKGICLEGELGQRTDDLAARPHGHDHPPAGVN